MTQGDGFGTLQVLDALVDLLEIQTADAVKEFAHLVVWTQVGIALIELACLLVVAEAEQSVSLVEDGLGVIGVDGDGELAALYGVADVVVHVLRHCEMIPIGRRVGVAIDELVEDALALIEVTAIHRDASSQLLVVGRLYIVR